MRSGPALNSCSPPLFALKNARSGELVPALGCTTQPPPGKLTPVAASYCARMTSLNGCGRLPSGRCSKSILHEIPPNRPTRQNAGTGTAEVAGGVGLSVAVEVLLTSGVA